MKSKIFENFEIFCFWELFHTHIISQIFVIYIDNRRRRRFGFSLLTHHPPSKLFYFWILKWHTLKISTLSLSLKSLNEWNRNFFENFEIFVFENFLTHIISRFFYIDNRILHRRRLSVSDFRYSPQIFFYFEFSRQDTHTHTHREWERERE